MKLADAAVISLFLAGCAAPPGELAGPFERVGSYLTGAHPVTAVVQDVDGDGDDDLVAPALLTDDVIVIENTGGELGWHQIGPLEVGAGEAIGADVDGDGTLELITANRDLDRVDIYAIDSGPSLAHRQTLEVIGATGLAAADLDGDGDTDLIVTRFRDASIEIFEQSDGALVRRDLIATAAGPFAVRAANVDGVGALELVVAAATADRVQIFGSGAGGWSERASIATGRWPSSVLVGDTVRVGDAARTSIYGAVTISDEIFRVDVWVDASGWRIEYTPVAGGDGAFALTFVDIGGQSAIAVTNKDEDTVSIFAVEESGALAEIATFATGEASGPTPILAWDYNGDQATDLAVVNAFSDEVVLFRGR